MPHIEVVAVEDERWLVRYEGDPTPLSEHATRDDPIADARNHAREFPEPILHVRGKDGEVETQIVEPDHSGPAPRRGLGDVV